MYSKHVFDKSILAPAVWRSAKMCDCQLPSLAVIAVCLVARIAVNGYDLD